jgi:hypothetical protein
MEYLKENGLGNRSSHRGFLKSQKNAQLGGSFEILGPVKRGKAKLPFSGEVASYSGSERPVVYQKNNC